MITQLRAKMLSALDALIAAGKPYGGLFPSILTLDGQAMQAMPKAIPGQRDNDRAYGGSNLMHDHQILKLMLEIGERWALPTYAAAAHVYLDTFSAHCATPSGLFPWGEHSYLTLPDLGVGNSYVWARKAEVVTHDHLRQAPTWLWRELWRRHPECVRAFAHGLDNHRYADADQYMRHARILVAERNRQPGPRACDFPRHAGFYLQDLAFVLHHEDDPGLLDLFRWFLDYWWTRKHPTGLCNSESRTPPQERQHHGKLVITQTISLALSLYDAAGLMEQRHPKVADTCRQRARHYLDACLDVGHHLADGLFLGSVDEYTGERRPMEIWGGRYGEGVAAKVAINCLGHFEHHRDPRCLDLSIAITRAYLNTPIPASDPVTVTDIGQALMACAGVYRHTRDQRWLDDGLALAERAQPLWWDRILPRIAIGVDHYESQQVPGFLLHGLAELIDLAEGGDRISPDRSSR